MLRISRGHILWSTVRLCHIFWCQSESKPFSKRGPKAMHPIMRLRGHQFHKRATSAMLTIDKDKRSPLPAYATQNFIGADFHNGQAFILLSHNDDKSPTCIIYGHRLMAFIFHETRSEYSKRNDHLTSSDSGKGLPQNEQSKVRIFSARITQLHEGNRQILNCCSITMLRSDNIIQTCYGVAWIEEYVIIRILTMWVTTLRMNTMSGVSHFGSLIRKRQQSDELSMIVLDLAF